MGVITPILYMRNSSEWHPLTEVHSVSSTDKEFLCLYHEWVGNWSGALEKPKIEGKNGEGYSRQAQTLQRLVGRHGVDRLVREQKKY